MDLDQKFKDWQERIKQHPEEDRSPQAVQSEEDESQEVNYIGPPQLRLEAGVDPLTGNTLLNLRVYDQANRLWPVDTIGLSPEQGLQLANKIAEVCMTMTAPQDGPRA